MVRNTFSLHHEHNSTNYSHSSTDWGASHVAVQSALGLLSQWWTRLDSFDRNNPGVIGRDLTRSRSGDKIEILLTRKSDAFNDFFNGGRSAMRRPGSEKRGELMERKESDEPFKGVAKEKDERRKSS
jgi:hypothetical protein